MSQVVDTKVVEMQFDNSKFEKNIQTSLNSLKFLNKSIEDAGKNRNSLDELAKAGDQVGLSFDNMSQKTRITVGLMDLLAGVGTKAFNRISDAVAGFAMNMANSLSGMQAMRDGFNEYELKMGSVQTILAGAKIKDPLNTKKWVTDDARRLEIVNDQLEKLNAYSDRTIYSFKDMTSNIGKFTNAGVDLDTAVKAIQGVANVAAISGANANEASRAMYNFSQALSSGNVKLIDWKSIENANMATVDFKEELIKTALEVGTLKEEGGRYISTVAAMAKEVSSGFTATSKFNDALSSQWLSSEVLTKTLAKYTDETTALGKKAFAAATEVKTFSQMIDTLKESLGSGWAQTWEIVFGDFNEAKKLWTGLNNTIDGILSPIGKVRNEILKVWKADGGRDAMIKSFSNLFQAAKNLIAPIKELWKALTPNTEHSGKILATIFKGIEKLTAMVAKAAGVIGKVLATVLKPVIFFGNLIGKGLVKLVGLVRSAFAKIVSFFSPIKQTITTIATTFTEAFDKHIVARVKTLQSTLGKFFNNLKTHVKNNAALQKLAHAFGELRTIIQDLFGRILRNASFYASGFVTYLGRIWHAIEPLISSAITRTLKSLADFLLPKLEKALGFVAERIRRIGDLISKINIKDTKFYKGLADLPNKLASFADSKAFAKIKSFANTIKDFGSQAVAFLSEKFQNLKADIEAIKMPHGLSDVFDNIKNFIKSIFGADSVKDTLTDSLDKAADAAGKISGEDSGKKLTTFQKFLKGLSDAFDWLKNAAIKAKDALADFVGFVIKNTPKAFSAFYKFLAGDDGILQLSDLTNTIYMVSDALSMLLGAMGFQAFGKGVQAFGESLGELSLSINNFLKQSANKARMSAIKDFAIALGILVGSLYILSKIPKEQLIGAVSALGIVGLGLIKFFDQIGSTDFTAVKVAGNLSIAALFTAIGVAMIGIATSIGMLVGALALLPKVIKQYNNLGDEFRTGMERVGEVLKQMFEYLDHSINGKYSLRSAAALYILVATLKKMRKVVLDFAKEENSDPLELGLTKIKRVLSALGDFLRSITIFDFTINVGVNFNTLGIAAIIWTIGDLLEKIVPVIKKAGKIPASEMEAGMTVITKILWRLGIFIAAIQASSFVKAGGGGTNLREWIGISLTVSIIAYAISSIVGSIELLTKAATGEAAKGFDDAVDTIQGIFIGIAVIMGIVGALKPAGAGVLFSLSVSISLLCICVAALTPLAKDSPYALAGAVGAVGGLMIALGVALFLAGKASNEIKWADVVKLGLLIAGMIVVVSQIRRLAMTGGDAGSIVAAGAAIAGAILSLAGAMKIMSSIKMINPLVIAGLAAIAFAIWGVAAAIKAFKGSTGDMAAGANSFSDSTKQMEDSVKTSTENMSAFALDAMPPIIKELGASIGQALKEAFGNFDLGGSLRNVINTVKQDAKNWGQDFIDVGTNIINGISTALENPANIEKIKGSMKALGKALVDAFKSFLGINSPSTVMIEQGGYIIDGLVQGLMEYPTKLAEWVTGIGTYIKDGISGFFTDAVTKGQEFVDNLGQGIQNGKEAVGKKAAELGRAALQKVSKAKDWAKQAGTAVSSFGSKLQNSKNPIKSAAGSMIVGATNVVSGISKSFRSTASTAASTFSAQIKSGASPARAAGSAVAAAAKGALSGVASAFRTTGYNAAQGFKNGINSLISSIAAKAREMVRAAKNAAKSEQHSNSPSKDFMEFGGWAAQGYALGLTNRKDTKLIEQNAMRMVNTAKGIASGTRFGSSLYFDSNPALTSLAYAMAQISDSLDDTMDSNPTIRPVIDMSNVNQGASLISGMFGDKNFKANLEAAGSIQNGLASTMARRNAAMSTKSIDELSNRLDVLTSAMNSRTMNNYITVDGAEDPQLFADKLVRSMRLNARTI